MTFGLPPSLDDIETIARASLGRLPEPFAGYLKNVVLIVEDIPSEDLLDQFEIEDAYELTGLYTGRPAELATALVEAASTSGPTRSCRVTPTDPELLEQPR